MNGQQLLEALSRLTDDQRQKFDIAVSAGCDDNGNAEFFKLDGICVVGDGVPFNMGVHDIIAW